MRDPPRFRYEAVAALHELLDLDIGSHAQSYTSRVRVSTPRPSFAATHSPV
jgi:hypothetical protein